MAQSFGDAVTLTASWDDVGTVDLQGSWLQNTSNGMVTIRLKHTKHASQSGGYPVVRVRTKVYNAAGDEATCLDSLVDSTITTAAGVATVKAYTPEIEVLALTDSDGAEEFALVIQVPPSHTKVLLQAKQAGDTTNFGALAAELDGRI